MMESVILWTMVIISVSGGQAHMIQYSEPMPSMIECFEEREILKAKLPKYGNQIVCVPERFGVN